MFLGINLGFMSIQLFYGYMSKSLNLISESIHLLCDSLGLIAGMVAAYVATKGPTSDKFPFGMQKAEALSGLVQGVFLGMVAFNLFMQIRSVV